MSLHDQQDGPHPTLRWAVAVMGIVTILIGSANDATAMVTLGLIGLVLSASADEL